MKIKCLTAIVATLVTVTPLTFFTATKANACLKTEPCTKEDGILFLEKNRGLNWKRLENRRLYDGKLEDTVFRAESILNDHQKVRFNVSINEDESFVSFSYIYAISVSCDKKYVALILYSKTRQDFVTEGSTVYKPEVAKSYCNGNKVIDDPNL